MESATVDRTQDLEGRLDAQTIIEAFRSVVDQHPDRVAVRTKDDEVSLSYRELAERVDALAGGLAELGVGRGDVVAMMLGRRPEFHIADLAAMTLGATTLSIYETYTPDQITYLLDDAQAKLGFVEEAYHEPFVRAAGNVDSLEHVITVDGDGDGEAVQTMAEVERSGEGFDASSHWQAVEPDDLLTLIYTSGTTGKPKGVQLSHRNLITASRSFDTIIEFPEGARVISWLPAAHIAERAAHHYLPMVFGFTVTVCPDTSKIGEYLPAVRPTWFFAVPRIWEKIKSGLESKLAQAPDEDRERAEQALEAAKKKVRLEQEGQEVPDELAEKVAQADEQLFSNLRAMLGLDQLEAVNVGAAPTPAEVLEFFHAIGVPIAELWGMSETCGSGCVNPPDRVKIGTVGPPAPGVEVKLGESNELLMRGGMVMEGYRNLPDKTAETIDDDGWLHTGDVAEIDDDGYVKIVDRLKEIIINAAGKNMSPAEIEAQVKSASPLIGQAIAIGDDRRYVVGLIVLDPDYAPGWAEEQGIEDTSLDNLATHDTVVDAVGDAVAEANDKLASVEQLKYFTIVKGDWEPGGDELTPTMKLKRKPIHSKYEQQIEAMYEQEENNAAYR